MTGPQALPRRPLLAGNAAAGVDALRLFLEVWAPEDVLVVAPAEGVRHDWQPSLVDAADAAGVEVLTPGDVNDPAVVDRVRDRGTDLLLSVYYTQLFRAPLLDAINGLALNVHPALLPRHRGTAPLIWAIAEGDTTTGVSAHELTLGVDTGPLRWQHPLPIHRDDTGHSLHDKATNLTRAIVADLLRRLVAGRPLPEPVEQSGPASVHTTRDPRLNRIDWHEPAERIRNVVRALAHPLPGAHTSWRGQPVGLERVEVVVGRRAARTPGMVQLDGAATPEVWTGDLPVRLDLVRLDGETHPGSVLVERGMTDGEVLG